MVWPAVIGALGAVAGGLLSAKGQRDANEANLLASNEGRRWMEVMSETAYQRAVKDMQAAGLSPMLAYSQGGASVPSQSAPIVQNALGAGVSGAAQAAQAVGAIQQVQQSQRQQELLASQTAEVQSRTINNELHSARAAAEIRQLASQTKLTDAHWDNVQQAILGTIADSATKHATFQEMNKGGGFAADVARKKAEAEIAKFGVSEAKAGSKFYEDVEAMPKYLRMILELLRGTSSARSMLGH